MRKIFYSVFLPLLLIIMTIAPSVKAEGTQVRIADSADIVTDAEEQELQTLLDEVSAKYDVDIVIATTNLLLGATPEESADIAYDTMGCKEDGMILYISMVTRDVYIRPQGNCDEKMIRRDGAAYMIEKITPALSDGDYADAFKKYISLSDKFLEKAQNGEPYDGNNMPRDLMDYLKAIGIALLIGLVIGFLVVSSMKAKLKTVGFNRAAADYVKPGSMYVSQSNDMFLYRTVNRRARPKSNSSGGGGGSSGGGGAGGKF